MKFIKSGISKFYIFVLILVIGCISVGSAAFVYVQNNSISSSEGGVTVIDVARNVTKGTTYKTIHTALEEAESGDTVTIIPNTNAVLYKNATIKSGVTLSVPLSDGNIDVTSANGNSDIAYEELTKEEKVKFVYTIVNSFTIDKNVTLNVLGTLSIYGQLSGSGGGADYVGQPCGNTTCIFMESGSLINATGTTSKVIARGFIKDAREFSEDETKPKINIHSGADIKMPYVLRDFKGGSVSAAIYKETFGLDLGLLYKYTPVTPIYAAPFYQFQIVNVEPILDVDYDSTITSIVNIDAGGQMNSKELNFLGKDENAFLQFTSTYSKMIADYDSDSEICDVNFIGGLRMNGMAITLSIPIVGDKSFDTADYVYPLSWRHKVTLSKDPNQESATYTINQDFKILPGSYLEVAKGANLVCSGAISIYEYGERVNPYFNDSNYLGELSKYNKLVDADGDGVSTIRYAQSTASTTFLISGNLTANKLGGIIKAGEEGATFIASESSIVSFYEATSYEGSNYQTVIKNKDLIDNPLKGNFKGTFTSLSANTLYTSDANNSWTIENFEEKIVVDSATNITISSDDDSASKKLSATIYGLEASEPQITITDSNGNTPTTLTETHTVFSYDSNTQTRTIDITLNASDSTAGEYTYTLTITCGDKSATCTITVTKEEDQSGGTCLAEGTLITLANGTQKAVENIKAGDELLVFNHEIGKFDTSTVLFNDTEEMKDYKVINLVFESGRSVKVIGEHGLFDLDTMQYEYIDISNYETFIGHAFVNIGDRVNFGKEKLVDAFVTNECIKVYSPVTKYHLNYFSEGMLSMPGGIKGLFNIFDIDEDLSYNEINKARDIEQYGLFTYEDFKDLVSYEIYESFPTPYLKVSIGKGKMTYDDLRYYIERYTPLM